MDISETYLPLISMYNAIYDLGFVIYEVQIPNPKSQIIN